MTWQDLTSFVHNHLEAVGWILTVVIWLVSGFFAGIISRIVSSDWYYENEFKDMFRFFCPILGPLGLLASFAVFVFWYLPKKMVG